MLPHTPFHDSVDYVDQLGGRLSVEQERLNQAYDALGQARLALRVAEQRQEEAQRRLDSAKAETKARQAAVTNHEQRVRELEGR